MSDPQTPVQPSPTTAPAGRPTRGELVWRLAIAALLMVPVCLFNSADLLRTIPKDTSGFGWTATMFGWVSTMAMLGLVGWLLLAPILLIWPRRWLLITTLLIGGIASQVALFADTVIYGLFRTHFNHMVWLALTTPGAGDSIHLGGSTWFSTGWPIALSSLAVAGITWLTMRPAVMRCRRWRVWLPAAAALFALAATDKVLFVIGDLAHRADVTRIDTLFPLYQPVYMRRFAKRMGWTTGDDHSFSVKNTDGALRYPLEPIVRTDTAANPNILLVAIEGMRADQVNPEVMPHLSAFAANNITATNHWSGGNATRFGLFSLFYGIHAAYWPQVLAERQGPVLIDTLITANYRMHVDSCTDLNFPEFRQTAFVAIPDAIHDTWDDSLPRYERDRSITNNAVACITQTSEQPFFQFAFYDASHSSYVYPPEHAIFDAAAPHEIDFVRISQNSDVASLSRLYNRYRNSLHYIDEQLGRLFTALTDSGQLDNTIVIIVGDHGEEFGELGLYGHNGSFSRYQAGAACIVKLPGVKPAIIDRLTSHVDIVPTIMHQLGVTTPVSAYSQGVDLSATDVTRDHLIAVSFNDLGIIDNDAIIVIGTGGFNPRTDVLDHHYLPVANRDAVLAPRIPWIRQLMLDLRTYLK